VSRIVTDHLAPRMAIHARILRSKRAAADRRRPWRGHIIARTCRVIAQAMPFANAM
jgi:hypothetical protein